MGVFKDIALIDFLPVGVELSIVKETNPASETGRIRVTLFDTTLLVPVQYRFYFCIPKIATLDLNQHLLRAVEFGLKGLENAKEAANVKTSDSRDM